MSTPAALAGFLAIEARLQFLDRGAGQHQSLMLQNVVDIGTDGREQVDLAQVGRGLGEPYVQRIAVDHQRGLAEAELSELLLQRLGLGFADVEIFHHDQLAVARLGGQRHFQAQCTHLLVQQRIEVAHARTVRLAATDENRGTAIAVTGGAAALLLAIFLAGAGDIAALASAAGSAAALLELPSDDAVENVRARLYAEDRIVELNVAAALTGKALYLDLHVP